MDTQACWCDAASMAEGPARVAHLLGLVGNHLPETRKLVGAWRWPLVAKHAQEILPIVANGFVLDYGGGMGPIGYKAIQVDAGYDEPRPRHLHDIAGQVDAVFTSHTLEHLRDVGGWLAACAAKIKAGGFLIVQVPSWQKTKLNAANWQHHFADFCFEADAAPEGVIRLDTVLSKWFSETLKEGDEENLLWIGQRK